MIINCYNVVSTLDKNEFVAKKDELYYLIYVISDRKLIRNNLNFFINAKKQYFTDFVEYFTLDGKLFLVFNYNPGPRLSVVAPKMHFTEKHMLIRTILHALTMQDIPSPILCDILNPENICISDTGRVSFVYSLSVFKGYNRNCDLKSIALFASVVRFVYGTNHFPLVQTFIVQLERGEYDSIGDVLIAYNKIYDQLCTQQPLTPVTFRDRLNALKPRLTTVTAILLMFLSIAAICYSIYISIFPSEQITGTITAIGTVTVDEVSED